MPSVTALGGQRAGSDLPDLLRPGHSGSRQGPYALGLGPGSVLSWLTQWAEARGPCASLESVSGAWPRSVVCAGGHLQSPRQTPFFPIACTSDCDL